MLFIVLSSSILSPTPGVSSFPTVNPILVGFFLKTSQRNKFMLEEVKYSWASLVTQLVKNLPAMQDTWIWSWGWQEPLEKEKAIHSSILAWGKVAKSWIWLSDFHFDDRTLSGVSVSWQRCVEKHLSKLTLLICKMGNLSIAQGADNSQYRMWRVIDQCNYLF